MKCVNEFVYKEKILGATEVSQTAAGKNEKLKRKYKSIVFLLVLIVVALAIGLFCFFGTKDDEKEIGENTPENKSEEQQIFLEVEAGDTIVFGSYLEEPIEWRVLSVSQDGKSAVVISKNILSMKAYDAAESGKYTYVHLCKAQPGAKILAKPVAKHTKVFSRWNYETYMNGEVGDMLCYSADDLKDVYIVKKDIFGVLYEEET